MTYQSADEGNAQQHVIQVLNFLAERGWSPMQSHDDPDKSPLPRSSDYSQVQEFVL